MPPSLPPLLFSPISLPSISLPPLSLPRLPLFATQPCWLCQTPSSNPICAACHLELPWQNPYACYQCQEPLHQHPHDHSQTHSPLSQKFWCEVCVEDKPAFKTVISPFLYQDQIKFLIQKFKQSGNLAVGRYLSQQLAFHILGRISWDDAYWNHDPTQTSASLPLPCPLPTMKSSMTSSKGHPPSLALGTNAFPEIIIPVPSQWSKTIKRGFQPTAVIAESLSHFFGVPWSNQMICLKKTVKTQHTLSAEERQENIKDAFFLLKPVANKRIALVDDVVTTTATIREVSQLLISAGAESVEVWSLARTP